METKWILATLIFLAYTFLIWKVSVKEYKMEHGRKARIVWGGRLYFWHWIVLFSGVLTLLTFLLLKELSIIPQ